LFAESLKLNFPVLVPTDLGENVTDVVQLPPAARVLGLIGQFELTPKSVELLVMELMVSAAD